jgi:glycyl-tRNA synthetase beta chain
MDRELLIEIGVEELPAAWLPDLTKQMAARLEARLRDMRMAPDVPVEGYSTPRRLTARVSRIPERQEDLDQTVTGPPVSAAISASGEPTAAGLGFARKQGVPFEALERHETPKGTYLLLRKRQRGKSAVDALPQLLGLLLRDLSFPKQMHWDAMLDDGRGELLFGRPIRWLLFLYGGRVVPFSIGRLPAAAGPLVQEVGTGAVTYGHRFLATSGRAGRSIKVRTFDDYRARLGEHFVILDHAERRDRIVRELELKARKLSGRVVVRDHAGLVEEVADLVEYPGVVAGFFERSFLDLPQEVLTTTLVHHQHFFPVTNDKGELKEAFLAVVNTSPADERPIARNAERVVTARLRDAKFFWDADRRTRLEDRLARLDTVVFHKKLGSYRQKAERIEALARTIAIDVFGRADLADAAAMAGRLAKADLTTDMVFEFPELQGTMGGIYARAEGLPESVWKAIYYQYLPLGIESDAPPTRSQLGEAAVTWAAVSLADKLDTVAGLFFAGERHSGSRDPFGLRRAANGALRILIDLPELTGEAVTPSLQDLLNQAAFSFGAGSAPYDGWPMESVTSYTAFWPDRLRSVLESRGADARNVRALLWNLTVPLERLRPLEVRLKLQALPEITSAATFQQLARAFKRVRNIARELDSSSALLNELQGSALEAVPKEPAEVALLTELNKREPVILDALASRDYRRAFSEAAGFGPTVDRFFTEVFVMSDDLGLRTARLRLMKRLEQLILNLADISEIVPEAD